MKLKNLEMPKLHIHCKVEKDGETLYDTYQIGHSWTRNAYHCYNMMMLDSAPTADIFYRTTSGPIIVSTYVPTRTWTLPGYGYYNNTVSSSYGICVGTGSTAFHLDDYRLESWIQTGNSSGQLSYQIQDAPVNSWLGDPDYEENILHKRIFNNNSGSSITVSEVGLVYMLYGTTWYVLMSRDVLESPVTVVNGAQLSVTVSITSVSLVGIQNGAPAVGALGSGGIYIGQYHYDYTAEAPGSHGKYGLILAKLTDGVTAGQSSALAWRNPAAATTGADLLYYGKTNTDALVALGASSPIGAFVTAANAGALGGFADWYIPAYYETRMIYTNQGYIPSGEECDNANYWTSSYYNSSTAYYRNPITDAAGDTGQTATYKVRLIRRFLISDWEAET